MRGQVFIKGGIQIYHHGQVIGLLHINTGLLCLEVRAHLRALKRQTPCPNTGQLSSCTLFPSAQMRHRLSSFPLHFPAIRLNATHTGLSSHQQNSTSSQNCSFSSITTATINGGPQPELSSPFADEKRSGCACTVRAQRKVPLTAGLFHRSSTVSVFRLLTDPVVPGMLDGPGLGAPRSMS
jgi:hypothetical protein